MRNRDGTAITDTDQAAEEFLTTAQLTLRREGPAALDTLGWWDLLDSVEDRILRFGVFTVFRAQGRELADTPALGALMAAPYLRALGLGTGTTVAAVLHSSPRRGDVALVLGDTGGRDVLLDRPGAGLELYPASALGRRRVLPGRLTITELDVASPARVLDLDGHALRTAHAEALVLGRIAAANEILGAAEGAVELATQHAGLREQFGEPIGRFQAVRHLLAWAETETVALAAVVRQALWDLADLPPHYDETAKALAGRNGRRACERSLQVLGGIGFTTEHQHHHHHSRVLLLDSLLGTSAELTRVLGSRARESGATPAFTEHAIACLD